MSVNLLRNSRVFFTTNVSTTAPNIGKVNTGAGASGDDATAHTNEITFEIQTLDDLTFSQTTATETIAVNETGDAPIRGQRTFNTAVNPVEWSFTTYLRPYSDATADKITCEERVLWNAMFSKYEIGNTTNSAQVAWRNSSAQGSNQYAQAILDGSALHQLQRFGLIVIFDNNVFLLDDCAINTATIDFGIDAIASVQWSGMARKIRRLDAPTFSDADTWAGTLVGDFKPKITEAPFIANKLSTVTLKKGIGAFGSSGSGDQYNMPLTGGSITLTNNITYLTPAYMGVINEPITYFTGSRQVSGSLSAYLRTGTSSTKRTAELFSNLVDNIATDSDPEFYLQVEIGGSSNTVRVELEMPGTVLSIPSINAESVITTTVNFSAQGSESIQKAGSGVQTKQFNIVKDNEIKIKYYAS